MPLSKFTPLTAVDKTTTLIQQNINKALDPVTNNNLVNGLHVTSSVTGNDIDIAYNHNLGTSNVGYHLGSSTSPVQAYLSPNNSNPRYNPTPNQTTLMRFSSTHTLSTSAPDIEVYFFAKD